MSSQTMQHRAKKAVLALMWVALGAQALTFGRVSGGAVIGQPLDVVIKAQLDAPQTASQLCLDAEVFHADVRQDPSRVQVGVKSLDLSGAAEIRIQSGALIDEPVVTVHLHSGCSQKATLRFVVLAEQQETAGGESASAAAVVVSLPTARDKPLATVKPQSRTQEATGRAPSDSADKKKTASSVPGKARLTLDPLGEFSDRVALLENPPIESAAADVLLAIQRIRSLDADVKDLHVLAASNEASIAVMKNRLQNAGRISDAVVYGLSALVVLSMAGVALMWRRRRSEAVQQDDDWSNGSPQTHLPAAYEVKPTLVPVPKPVPEIDMPAPKVAPAAKVERFLPSVQPDGVDVGMIELSESNFAQIMNSGTTHSVVRKLPDSPSLAPAMSANLFQTPVFSSGELDLDLSGDEAPADSAGSESGAQSDRPMFMPLDDVLDAQECETLAPSEPDDLLQFELPKSSK